MGRFLAILVLLVVLCAPIIAAANIPDPTWIPGLYDSGDGDEALSLVWDNAPAVATTETAYLTSVAVAPLTVDSDVQVIARRHSAFASRAPPLT